MHAHCTCIHSSIRSVVHSFSHSYIHSKISVCSNNVQCSVSADNQFHSEGLNYSPKRTRDWLPADLAVRTDTGEGDGYSLSTISPMFVWSQKMSKEDFLMDLDLRGSCIIGFHSFSHSDHFCSASSSQLLLRSASDTARICRILCLSFTPKRHRQL